MHNGSSKDNDQQYSVVEVKESTIYVNNNNGSYNDPKIGQIVDTVSILESCNQFEPQQVETVNIIDIASSDTDTANSTPQLNRKKLPNNSGSIDELQTELQRELETVSFFDFSESSELGSKYETKRISYNEDHKVLEKDRDVLLDSEVEEKKIISMMKLRPTLQELLMEERNSFYSADKDNDEPLEFSDDDEIPRFSVEIDSDSDLVKKIVIILLRIEKCSKLFY